MVRGKRMSAKVQSTVDLILNGVKEPKFTALNSDKINLIRGLNYYANHATQEQSKKWSIEWAKKNMPEIVLGLNKQKDWHFNNNGFVLRMVENGFVLEQDQLEKIKTRLVEISQISESVTEEKVAPVKKVVAQHNKTLEKFDYAIDAILMGQNPESIPFDTNKKNHAEVLAKCDKMLQEMEDAPEYFAKNKIRPMKKFLSEVKKQLHAIMHVVKQQRVRKVKPKKVNPIKLTNKMPFKRKNEELGLESLRPESLIGAKQAIVYNAKYRFLMYFKAASDDGFSVSGATLKNYDIEKSVFKKIRNPENMVKSISGLTLAGMRKFLDTVNAKAFPCKGRFNEETLILKVTG